MVLELSLPGDLLPSGAVLSELDLRLPEQTTLEQWQSIGRQLGRLQRASSWWVGDWWTFGEHKWGERKATVESEDWNGPAYQSCVNAGNVCKKFESNRRRLHLAFGHHAEVASIKDEALRESLLDWCEAPLRDGTGKAKTIKELRAELVARGLRPAKGPALEDSRKEGADDSAEEFPNVLGDLGDLGAEIATVDESSSCVIDLGTTPIEITPSSPQDMLRGFREGYVEKVHAFIGDCSPALRVELIQFLLQEECSEIRRSFTEEQEKRRSG